MLIFDHTLVTHPTLRFASLIVTPLLAGGLSLVLASYRQHSRDNVEPIVHFWQAFWFALGFVLIRFIYVTH